MYYSRQPWGVILFTRWFNSFDGAVKQLIHKFIKDLTKKVKALFESDTMYVVGKIIVSAVLAAILTTTTFWALTINSLSPFSMLEEFLPTVLFLSVSVTFSLVVDYLMDKNGAGWWLRVLVRWYLFVLTALPVILSTVIHFMPLIGIRSSTMDAPASGRRVGEPDFIWSLPLFTEVALALAVLALLSIPFAWWRSANTLNRENLRSLERTWIYASLNPACAFLFAEQCPFYVYGYAGIIVVIVLVVVISFRAAVFRNTIAAPVYAAIQYALGFMAWTATVLALSLCLAYYNCCSIGELSSHLSGTFFWVDEALIGDPLVSFFLHPHTQLFVLATVMILPAPFVLYRMITKLHDYSSTRRRGTL
jgi:hypothetical protein